MRKAGALAVAWALSLVAPPSGDSGKAGDTRGPADFKLVIAHYGVRKEPVGKAELVVRNGSAYHFVSEPPLEVIIHDPAAQRLELLDLDRKVRSDITLKSLDAYQRKLRDAIAHSCEKLEAQGGRANLVASAMSRNLIDPRFHVSHDAASHEVRLTNPTVEVEARGEPEPDRARLSLIADSLAALAKLDAVRESQGVPPFSRLETLRALTVDHRLRPTETSFLFRLAGPPRKVRWTYRLVPELTGREVEAISRVDAMRARCHFVRFERYNRPQSN
jgi:hypothetical protein